MSNYPEYLWDYPEPSTASTVNLNDRGLSDGDLIDPYLDQYFRDGVRVEIEPGEYMWNRSAPHGSYQNAAMVGLGEVGDVVFRHTARGTERGLNVLCTGGTILWENITIRGGLKDGNCRIRCDARSTSSEVVFKHVRLLDGNRDGMPRGGGTQGVYAGGAAHVGVLRMLWCHVEGFVDNGVYADGWAGAGRGQVIVAGGLYKNNNISQVRVGNDHSRVYKATVVVEDDYPHSQTRNQRGIRIRRPHDSESTNNNNIIIDDCDIWYERGVVGTALVSGEPHLNRHSHVTVRNCRIQNNSDDIYAILNRGDGTFIVDNCHVTGRGETRVLGATSQRNMPSNPQEPDLDPWWGDDVELGDGDSGNEDSGNVEQPEDTVKFVIDSHTAIRYVFHATGEITPAYGIDTFPANPETQPPGDYAAPNGDGTWTALGHSGGGGDTYFVEGDITGFHAVPMREGDPDASFTLYVDDEEVDPATFESPTSDGDGYTEQDLSEAYDEGHDVGYEAGFIEGREEGYEHGLYDGRAEMANEAYDEGYNDGYEACQDDHVSDEIDEEEVAVSFIRRWLGLD